MIGSPTKEAINNPNFKKFIGLRNIVTDKNKWSYLLLYELDGHDENKLEQVLDVYNRIPISFICYKTKGGFHFVGLTPLNSQQWGSWLDRLQKRVPEYYAGNTLRVSLKEEEKQELIGYVLRYPYIESLAKIYFRRFDIKQNVIPVYGEMPEYSCVFEKYWTTKI